VLRQQLKIQKNMKEPKHSE